MQIAILGRQAKLSLAELESLFGSDAIRPIGQIAAEVRSNQPLPQARLGGTIKSAQVLKRLDGTDLKQVFDYLHQTIPEHLTYLPEGKLQLGISLYGFDMNLKVLLKEVLGLKKLIKGQGRSVRILENKKPALDAATVLYNKLTGELGWELLLIKDGKSTILAQTTGVQNIDDYSKRDFGRPKRDAYVGMLPPKLAQIMINLAGKHVPPTDGVERTDIIKRQSVLLDPFCGTGVILQEAMLMGYETYGTDISEKMVRYSRDNLNWLQEEQLLRSPWHLEIGDATTHDWRKPIDLVASEVFLGKPLTKLPPEDELRQIIHECNEITTKFLKNIGGQLKVGTRLCLALPAWAKNQRLDVRSQMSDKHQQTSSIKHQASDFYHLPLLDQIESFGYNRLDFVHAGFSDLLYHRENQVVARELTILEKR